MLFSNIVNLLADSFLRHRFSYSFPAEKSDNKFCAKRNYGVKMPEGIFPSERGNMPSSILLGHKINRISGKPQSALF